MGLNYQSTGVLSDKDYEPKANYTASETDPLKVLVNTRRMTTRPWIKILAATLVVLIVVLPILFETNAHLINQCPLSPKARDQIRGEWQKEVFVQENLRHEWRREEEEQRHKREEWKWEEEEQRHKREDWKWEEEERKYKREEWKREAEEHDREKRERQRMGMFWDQVEAQRCTTYGTREYTAYLANLPIDYPHRIEACRETMLEIHGKSYFPKRCEDQVRLICYCLTPDTSNPRLFRRAQMS
ncbi:hypothetical protein F5141DRAFT_244997 [Pisolithus sp. B1]|nr:hypothetical protein F5141DRAFT_244997 [Pisolithus sp. B1]